jgi:acyl carrier protein
MDRHEALWIIRQLVGRFLGLPPESITPATRLQEDLGLDSLDATELLVELAERHGVELRIEELSDFERLLTVGGVADMIVELQPAVGPACPS